MKVFLKQKVKPYIPEILLTLILVVFYSFVGCPLRFFLGVCCPGCGMTRAMFAVLRLDFSAAFQYHPLIFIMPVCVVIWLLRKKIPKKSFNLFFALIFTAFAGLYIYRLLTGNDYVYIDPTRGLIYDLISSFTNQ